MDLIIAPDFNDSSFTAGDPVAATAAKLDCNGVFPTGQTPSNHRSYCGWLLKPFLDPLCIPGRPVERFASNSPEPEASCRNFEVELRTAAGYGLAVLAHFANVYLGFNEPPMNPHSHTLEVAPRRETI